jgi:hypothetical protein
MTTKEDLIKLIKKDNVEELLKLFPLKQSKLEFCYEYATFHGSLKATELFITDERLDLAIDDNYAIRMSSANGHVDIVKLLLKNSRIDPGALFDYPLRMATENNYEEVVDLLLDDPRVDFMNAESEAVITSIKKDYLSIFKKFLMKLDTVLATHPILYEMIATTSAYGRLEMLRELYEYFPTDSKSYVHFNQILLCAVENGHVLVVMFLLDDFRADPNYNREEMINIARKNKHMDILNLLYKAQEKNRIFGNSKTTMQEKAKRLLEGGFITIEKADVKFSLNKTRRKVTLEFDL